MAENIVQFTSRSYDELKEDIINNLSSLNPEWTNHAETDLGITLIEVMAFLQDHMNFFIDKMVNESYPLTAQQRRSLLRLAEMIGWVPPNYESATATVTFALTSAHNKVITIEAGTTLLASSPNGNVPFFVKDEVVIPIGETTVDTTVIQGEQLTETIRASGYRDFTLSNNSLGTNPDYYTVTIEGTEWTYVESFKDSLSTDRHYTLRVDDNYQVHLVFGDGWYGRLPTNVDVEVEYVPNSGAQGNVLAGNITSVGTIRDVDDNIVDVTVSNDQRASGGVNPIPNILIANTIRTLHKMQDRALLKEDFETLLAMTGIPKQVKAYDVRDDRSIGYYFVRLYFLVDGGLTDLLKETLGERIDNYRYTTLWYDILDVTEVSVNVRMNLRVLPGHSYPVVRSRVISALVDYFTPQEYGSETGLIIGQTIRYSDIVGLIEGLLGVDYIELWLNDQANVSITVDVGEIAALGTIEINPV